MNHFDYIAQFVFLGSKILDVGSGRGKFLIEMAKRGFDVYGMEINPEYIKESKRRLGAANVFANITESHGEQLPFSDGYFDFINCAEVTEHVNNPIKLCREIYRVLKPSGKCYISFHNRFGFYDFHYHLYLINWLPRRWAEFLLKILKKGKEDGIAGRQKLATMHYFTYKNVITMLKTVGFSVWDIRVEKIKNRFGTFSFLFLIIYYLLRPFYFNSFHIMVEK